MNSSDALTRSYADRLILEKLSEMDAVMKLGELADKLSSHGLGLAAVRALMSSNPSAFAYHERRWVPAARLNAAGRPVAEAMTEIISAFGAPVAVDLVIDEVARIREASREEMEATVRRMIERTPQFVHLPTDKVALVRFGFVAFDELFERALAINGLTPDDVKAVQAKIGDVDFSDTGAIARALAKASPVSLKVLGALAYSSMNSDDPRSTLNYDAREFLARVLSIPGFEVVGGDVLMTDSDAKATLASSAKLAQKLTPSIDVDDAAPIELKKEDLSKLIENIVGSGGTVTATSLLENFFEITPASKTFPDDMANIMAALKQDSSVMWVGGDRFRKAGDVPEYIHEVPEPFQFIPSGVMAEDNDPVDGELTDEGLNSSLRKLLQHPLALDVLDEDRQPVLKNQQESVRLVLKSIHRELGTFPLAQFPAGWLAEEPKIQEAIFVDPAGRELQVWINTEARLMYGLIDWWLDQPIESGAVFTLTKTAQSNVFDFAYMDQPDPVVYISSQRMEELRALGAESEGKAVLDLLIEVMAHWPKGADFLTILAEVNVVRRSSRRLIASLLSSYQCFYQRSGSPVWHFDAKKVDQGFDKSKKKFLKK